MSYRTTNYDGKGNILDETIHYTVEQYKEIMLKELKQVWRLKFPSIEKQINLANGLLSNYEAAQVKTIINNLLIDYESKKGQIGLATTLEDIHSVLHS